MVEAEVIQGSRELEAATTDEGQGLAAKAYGRRFFHRRTRLGDGPILHQYLARENARLGLGPALAKSPLHQQLIETNLRHGTQGTSTGNKR